MRVRNFILAEAVGQSNGLYFLHGAGLERINTLQFPHVHPTIGLFLTIVIEPQDPAGEIELRARLVGEDGQGVDVIGEGKLQLPRVPDGSSREEKVLDLAAQKIGLTVPRPGRYWVTLEVGAAQLDRIPLYIQTPQSERPQQSA